MDKHYFQMNLWDFGREKFESGGGKKIRPWQCGPCPLEGLGQTKGQREGAMVSFVNSTQPSLTWEDGLKEQFPMSTGWWAHLSGVFLAELTEAGKTQPTSGRYHSMGLVSELCESEEGEHQCACLNPPSPRS